MTSGWRWMRVLQQPITYVSKHHSADMLTTPECKMGKVHGTVQETLLYRWAGIGSTCGGLDVNRFRVGTHVVQTWVRGLSSGVGTQAFCRKESKLPPPP